MSKSEALEARLIDFAVRIINVTSSLPRTLAGKHVASQLLRSGTSPAPNYAEACNAESRRDFLHKLRICMKELNESRIWLEIVIRSKMLPECKSMTCATNAPNSAASSAQASAPPSSRTINN